MRAAGLDLGRRRAAYVRVVTQGARVRIEEAALCAFEGPLEPDAEIDEDERADELLAALTGASVRAGAVCLGVPGKDAILRYLHLPAVPSWRLKLLLEDEIAEVAEKAAEPLSADHCLLTIPEELQRADAEELAVLVALAKETPLEARMHALEARGIASRKVMPTAVALFDAWVGLGYVDERTCVLVDASAEATELAIAREGLLVFARSLPPLPGMAQGETPRAADVARAIAGSLTFARGQQRLRELTCEAVWLSGELAHDRAFLEELGRALKAEAHVFDPLERLDTESLGEETLAALEGRGPELAIALGLALAGSHPRTVTLDLVPRSIRKKRELMTRTVWMIAAAVIVAVTLAGSIGRAMLERSAGNERAVKLTRLERSLEDRLAEVEAIEAQTRRVASVLGALGERTQQGEATLALLSALRRGTPGKVTLTEVALESSRGAAAAPAGGAAAAAGAAGPGEVAFRVQGEVDNAQGEAARLLGRLEAALRAEPRVSLARVAGTPAERPGGTLAFAMAVRVRAAAAQEEPR